MAFLKSKTRFLADSVRNLALTAALAGAAVSVGAGPAGCDGVTADLPVTVIEEASGKIVVPEYVASSPFPIRFCVDTWREEGEELSEETCAPVTLSGASGALTYQARIELTVIDGVGWPRSQYLKYRSVRVYVDQIDPYQRAERTLERREEYYEEENELGNPMLKTDYTRRELGFEQFADRITPGMTDPSVDLLTYDLERTFDTEGPAIRLEPRGDRLGLASVLCGLWGYEKALGAFDYPHCCEDGDYRALEPLPEGALLESTTRDSHAQSIVCARPAAEGVPGARDRLIRDALKAIQSRREALPAKATLGGQEFPIRFRWSSIENELDPWYAPSLSAAQRMCVRAGIHSVPGEGPVIIGQENWSKLNYDRFKKAIQDEYRVSHPDEYLSEYDILRIIESREKYLGAIYEDDSAMPVIREFGAWYPVFTRIECLKRE